MGGKKNRKKLKRLKGTLYHVAASLCVCIPGVGSARRERFATFDSSLRRIMDVVNIMLQQGARYYK